MNYPIILARNLTKNPEINTDFRMSLLRMRNTYTKQQENQRYTIFINGHKEK